MCVSASVNYLLINGRLPWLCLDKLKTLNSIKLDVNLSQCLGIGTVQQWVTLAIFGEKGINEGVRKIEDKAGILKK